MTRVDITSYLASCLVLALEEIQRLLPADSMLGPSLRDLMVARPLAPPTGLHSGLCLATCRALGGADERVLPAAAVVELYHSAFEPDGGGVDQAGCVPIAPHSARPSNLVNCVPNAVLALALEPLLEKCRALGSEQALKLLQVVGRMAREAAEGRAIELSWLRAGVWALSDADYRGMVLKKTGWRSFIAPMKIGAIVAGANGEQVALLEQFAADLGFAFQLHDDVISLSRADGALGSSSSAGARGARHTLPLMHAFRVSSPADCAQMEQVLARLRFGAAYSEMERAEATPALDQDIDFLLDRIRQSGGGEYAQDVGKGYANRARAALDRAHAWVPSSEHGGLLYALADFTIAKVF